ncbi:MAG TPA: TonB-dependent receptor, partial [Saprospiraceae bacterium]|nr:TonB-dependent receptor [Saprospiraceae bacterium]
MDLIRDLSFSSGGFESRYGDRMASVLDVRYKRPEDARYSLSGSLLGASAHAEGSKRIGPNAYNKFRYLVGARYKTNRYLLGSLDVKGEYVPDFLDLQTYLTYDITKSLQVGYIANYNDSKYNFVPSTRSTALGLINFALKLTSVFEGKETNRFVNGMQGLSFTYVPEKSKNPMYMKLLGSTYSSSEQENFDILGYYRLAQIETNFGSDQFGQEINLLGEGTQHTYARNYLYYTISNVEHKGGIEFAPRGSGSSNFLQWGGKFQKEYYDDFINEWERIDSAGYSLPHDGVSVNLTDVLKTRNIIENTKINGFIQNTFSHQVPGSYKVNITGGVRASYLSLANEFFLSPRIAMAYEPLGVNKPLSFSLAGGLYYQSPLYRELRRPNGSINTNLKSQKSIHLVGGVNYNFNWKSVSDKPFKLIWRE